MKDNNNMKEQEIKGIKENLIFYYPVGSKKMMAQRYNIKTDELVYETEISSQYEYDITLSVFRMFNNPDCPANRKKRKNNFV